MKNIIAALTVLLTVGSANAFGGFNNNSWDTPWGNSNQYQNDNGFFAFNGFSFFDPRWYSTEFTNMVNEFDAPEVHSKGYKEDNGIFAYNGNDFWDPRWYSQEFTNMVNEIDDDKPQAYKVKNVKGFPINDLLTINK
jgi:hypothetical protein